MSFLELFSQAKPLIGVIHLAPLPGAPRYGGQIETVYAQALQEAQIYQEQGVDGLIVENFGDAPFYPGAVPAETVAAMAAIARNIVQAVSIPVGINTLRNDATAAIAIATAAGAQFVRVNVHLGAVVADQGLIQGQAHESLRLRAHLRSNVKILADVGVKHAAPLVARGLAAEAKELAERGKVDALIVSGAFTGAAADPADFKSVQQVSSLPVLIGSGAQPDNLAASLPWVDGLIVGSYFKAEGQVENPVEAKRVAEFVHALNELR